MRYVRPFLFACFAGGRRPVPDRDGGVEAVFWRWSSLTTITTSAAALTPITSAASTNRASTTRETSKEKWTRQKEEDPDYACWATTLPLPDGEDPDDWKVLPFSDSQGNRSFIADIASDAGIAVYIFESGIFKKCLVTNELKGDLKGMAVDVMIWGHQPWHTAGAKIMLNRTGKWTAFTFQRLLEDLRQIALSRQDKGTLIVAFRDLAAFESQWDSDTISSVSSFAETDASDVVDKIIAPGGVVQKAQLSAAMAEYIAHSKHNLSYCNQKSQLTASRN
ncbi:hypothetical protein HDU88_004059 [Geranomyces variabilis]|nr:hypothetical protein HDU88_004059 [Geranomyces variabilis]